MGRGRKIAIAAALATALAVLPAGAAEATFPGDNGKIAFSGRMPTDTSNEIYTVNPDGSGLTRLTDSPGADTDPTWSPDGTKIVFASERDSTRPECGLFCTEIYSMNADGSSPTRLTTTLDAGEGGPAWSPDGAEIAFASRTSCCTQVVSLMNADGTNQHTLFTSDCCGNVFEPTWSPHGDQLGYEVNGTTGVGNHDGSGERFIGIGSEPSWSPYNDLILVRDGNFIRTRSANDDRMSILLTGGIPQESSSPVWSPDMERMAFAVDNVIRLMRADGTEQTPLVETDGFVRGIDWLAIPATIPGYARPKGASPMRVSLVPAYEECTAPDREHGPPLAFGSCSQPTQASQLLTVGTADSNGHPTLSIGYATIETLRGNPATPEDEADVLVTLDITDARRRSNLADYTGGLSMPLKVRLTDKNNGCCEVGGPHAGTVDEGWLGDSFDVGAQCAATADPDVGATCSVSTTIEAIAPATVLEGLRTTWQLGPIKVFAVGADSGPFAVQGIFAP